MCWTPDPTQLYKLSGKSSRSSQSWQEINIWLFICAVTVVSEIDSEFYCLLKLASIILFSRICRVVNSCRHLVGIMGGGTRWPRPRTAPRCPKLWTKLTDASPQFLSNSLFLSWYNAIFIFALSSVYNKIHCLIILHKFNAWASTAGTGDWRVHPQISMKTCFTWFKVVGGHWTDSIWII